VPRDKELHEDQLSTIANVREASIEEWFGQVPIEGADFSFITSQLSLSEDNDSKLELLCGRDDMSIVAEPTHHVDYLIYDWNERELLVSWRFAAKKR
jgi:hypothetical protein